MRGDDANVHVRQVTGFSAYKAEHHRVEPALPRSRAIIVGRRITGPAAIGLQDLVVALPREHQLAQLESVPISRLSGEAMISLLGTDDIGASLIISRVAAAEGIELHTKWQVSEYNGVLGLVAAGLGCGIVPKALARIASRDIVFRPLEPRGLHTEYWLVWNKHRATPAVGQFMNLVAMEPQEP
jgi:DNA-binding transcriptional LysR family regulator